MFTGFPTENTPAIQVWDFSRTFANTSAIRSVSLTDDCAPIQFFKTGATVSSPINVYLPNSPVEGRQLIITNQFFGTSAQNLQIIASDVSGTGAGSVIYTLGPGGTLFLVYTKQNISFGPNTGNYATGWTTLNSVSQNAANYGSVNLGGNATQATGPYSATLGGSSNSAGGMYAVVVGSSSGNASATGSSVVGSSTSTSSSNYSTVIGGLANTANGIYGAVIGGAYGTNRGIVGNFVTPASNSPVTGSLGVSQTGLLVLGVQTADATVTTLRSNTSAASTSNQVILPNNSAYYFRGSVIANVTGGGNTKAWSFEGAIKRGANAASTTLIQSVINPVAEDSGASAWAIALAADTTNGGLQVTVTGQAATTIRWVCRVQTTEVTF